MRRRHITGPWLALLRYASRLRDSTLPNVLPSRNSGPEFRYAPVNCADTPLSRSAGSCALVPSHNVRSSSGNRNHAGRTVWRGVRRVRLLFPPRSSAHALEGDPVRPTALSSPIGFGLAGMWIGWARGVSVPSSSPYRSGLFSVPVRTDSSSEFAADTDSACGPRSWSSYSAGFSSARRRSAG